MHDFFWTGVEDAPSWITLKSLFSIFENKGVHQKSYVDLLDESTKGFQENSLNTNLNSKSYLPVCKSCSNSTSTLLENDKNIGILIGDDPGPRLVKLNKNSELSLC